MPSSTSFAVSSGSRLRSTALVPTCQITRSGCMSMTAVCSRFIISGASSPPLPALIDGDVGGRILPAQLRGEPVGIGELRRGRAVACGRRRSERDDHHRLTRNELARDVRQRSHRFGAALRRQARHTAEDVAGRFRDFLHLVDRLAGDALLRGRIGGRRRAACGAALSAAGFCSVLFPDLALSDSAACWAVCCGAVWASSGDTAAGINSARLTAQTVGNVDKQKG